MAFDSGVRWRSAVAALLAIASVVGCATSRGSAGTRSQSAIPTDPPAGTVYYKGRTIVFDETADPPLLVIDGNSIKLMPGSGRHVVYTTCYATFTSLWPLARALIDADSVEKESRRRSLVESARATGRSP